MESVIRTIAFRPSPRELTLPGGFALTPEDLHTGSLVVRGTGGDDPTYPCEI